MQCLINFLLAVYKHIRLGLWISTSSLLFKQFKPLYVRRLSREMSFSWKIIFFPSHIWENPSESYAGEWGMEMSSIWKRWSFFLFSSVQLAWEIVEDERNVCDNFLIMPEVFIKECLKSRLAVCSLQCFRSAWNGFTIVLAKHEFRLQRRVEAFPATEFII